MDDLADTRAPTGFDLLTELGRVGWFVYAIAADEEVEGAAQPRRRMAVGATMLGRRHEVIADSVEDAAPELYRQAVAA